ncbi:MAG: alkyl hydroperoxide reductase [Planctomycetota bacterium]|jgi:hypothetical protein
MFTSRAYRLMFRAAGIYNIAFGLWAGLAPHAFFRLFEMDAPRYPQIWQCLGMVIGLYGILYWYAGTRLDRALPIIAIGLAGKVLGPLGFLHASLTSDWPARAFPLIVTNDLIWWLPFGAFVWAGLRGGRSE